MADFLLELLSEEIPARMQAGARADLERLFRAEMDAAGVATGDITVWSTPRRLALIARDLPTETAAVSEEAKGPPVGAPDQAVDGFCRKNGVTRDQLEERDVKGRATWFAVINKPGRAVAEVLAEAIPSIVRAFPWPKSMRWGEASLSTESLRWVRPLQGIVALLGEDLVECEVGGVKSGFATTGHRFHHSGDITIGSADDYAEKLRACHVVVDHQERQDLIRIKAAEAASAAGLTLVEDEGLVIENAGLTEWPVPLLGRFDESYLDVPPEVIQLTARVNQKYFVCEDADGNLANAFVCTANIDPEDPAVVVDGNRKVLAARLSDARFFWEQDRKTPLAEHAKKLERITFHEKLGTVADKVERVAKLARWLVEEGIVTDKPLPPAGGERELASDSEHSRSRAGSGEPMPTPAPSREREGSLADLAEQAARLAKADLVTEMVGEFPELQGLMGGYYARAEGLPAEVSDAIRDHYKPVGQGDDVPTAPVTVAVSLADKLDTLAGFYLIDEVPTGSKDPFALRRASISINRLIVENSIKASLDDIITSAMTLQAHPILQNANTAEPNLVSTNTFEDINRRFNQQKDAINEAVLTLRSKEIEIGNLIEAQNILQRQFSPILETLKSAPYLRAAAEISRALSPIVNKFSVDRLKVQQREAGVRHDLIDAVFALGGEDDLVRLLARVKALQSFIGTEDGTNLLAGYKRAANILKKEDWHGAPSVAQHTADEDPLENVDDPDMRGIYAALSYTPEPAEKALIEALDTAEPRAASAIEAEDFEAAMAALASLRAPIDRFFDEVTVNADEENKRAARLDLLARFRAAVHNVADFSRIEG